MKILLINGSPKAERSNTLQLARAFLRGMGDKLPTEVRTVTVSQLEIQPCRGCFACWNKTPGKCVLRDDMAPVLEDLLWADVIVWSFGLYYFNVPGKMKELIDRQLPLVLQFMAGDSESGGHPSRYDRSGQRHVVISTCGFYTAKGNYDSVNAMFDHFLGKGQYETLYCGQGELFRVQEVHQRTEAYLETVRRAGEEYAQGGVTPQTREKLEELLFPRETFEAMADASWGVEKETGQQEDPAYLFTKQMAALYNKNSYPGKDRVLEMVYTDRDLTCQLLLQKDGCPVIREDLQPYTTRIETPFSVWQDIAAGKISGTEALGQRLYRVVGDFDLMLHWDETFGAGKAAAPARQDAPQKGGKTSFLLLLLPWIAFWVAASLHPTVGPAAAIGVSALMGLIFLNYRRTPYDALSVVGVTALSLATLFFPEQWNLLLPLSYLAFGAMWCLSCLSKIPLTAWYSMNAYNGESALKNPLFLRTNRILCLAWGLLYVATAVWTFLLMPSLIGGILPLVNNVVPLVMGLFTKWFQKWYPAHYAAQ